MNNISMSQTTQYPESAQSDDEAIIIKNSKEIVSRSCAYFLTDSLIGVLKNDYDDTPVNYRKRFYKGEIACKNTFKDRVLSETPKFVKKRHNNDISESMSTFENANDDKIC